jgi:hypothetical protein
MAFTHWRTICTMSILIFPRYKLGDLQLYTSPSGPSPEGEGGRAAGVYCSVAMDLCTVEPFSTLVDYLKLF